MPLTICCPQCGLTSHFSDQAAGKTVQCPSCSQEMTLPIVKVDKPEVWAAEVVADTPGPPCPKCGSTATKQVSPPLYLGVIGAILMSPRACTSCSYEFDQNKPHVDLGRRKRSLGLIINGIGCAGILGVIGFVALVAYLTFQ